MTFSQFKKRLVCMLASDEIVDFWVRGVFIGFFICVLAPDSFVVPVWTWFFLLPALAALVFGIVGAVLGMLGCK